MTSPPRPRLLRRFGTATGLSLAETTLILSVLSIIGATMTPAVGDYVNDARMTKAQDDVRVLAMAVARLTFDVDTGAAPLAGVSLLVGPGAVPALGDGGQATWLEASGNDVIGRLEDHLVTNTAGYPARESVGLLRHGWRGPYLGTAVGTDPWGRRYAVNIGALSDGRRAVLVLSAGRNGLVETPFAALHPTPGGDDVVALVTSGGL